MGLEVGEGPEEESKEDSENREESKEKSKEESGESYELEDPTYLEALAASKCSGLLDFRQQGLSSSRAGPSVMAAEGTSLSASVPISPTTPARVFWSGTLHLSVPSAKGKGYLIFF